MNKLKYIINLYSTYCDAKGIKRVSYTNFMKFIKLVPSNNYPMGLGLISDYRRNCRSYGYEVFNWKNFLKFKRNRDRLNTLNSRFNDFINNPNCWEVLELKVK